MGTNIAYIEFFCNLSVLSVDPATFSGCYKCELTSVLPTIYSCSSIHFLTPIPSLFS